MVVTVQDFRTLFPSFSETLFSDEEVQFFLDVIQSSMNEKIWGEKSYKLYVCKWVAHELVVLYGQPTPDGNNLVANSGELQSATVARTSWTKNLTLTQVMGAGNYNATPYGRQWYQAALAIARLNSFYLAIGCGCRCPRI